MKNYVFTLRPAYPAFLNTTNPTQIIVENKAATSCFIQAVCLFAFLISSQIGTAQTSTWEGIYSSDWNNPDNWEGGQIPGATSHVIIPSTAHDPVIDATVNLKSILIKNSAGLSVNAGGGLYVTGNTGLDYGIKNQGTFTNIGIVGFYLASIGTDYAIVNEGIFENITQSSSQIDIAGFAGNGIWNKSGATFTNGSLLQIGRPISIGGTGIINNGTFHNLKISNTVYQGEINVGTAGGGAIDNSGGVFNNNAATILIDDQETTAITNSNNGNFKNFNNGNIEMGLYSTTMNAEGIKNDASDFSNEGATISIQLAGIMNTNGGTFENSSAGQIYIDKLSSKAVTTESSANFTNAGGSNINVGANNAVDTAIVVNGGTFTNSGGTIVTGNIKNQTIIVHSSGQFQNLSGAIIDINGHHVDASLGNADGIYVTNPGSKFTNSGSVVKIDGIGGLTNNAIYLSNAGIFESNSDSQVLIGQDAAVNVKPYRGIYIITSANFYNYASLIKIDRVKNYGIELENNGHFENSFASEIYIAQNSGLIVSSIYVNHGAFTNNECSLVWFAKQGIKDLANGFTNDAIIKDLASGTSIMNKNNCYYFNYNGGTVTIKTGTHPWAVPMTSSSNHQIWTGCSSTNKDWSTATNWVNGAVPKTTSNVVILPNSNNPIVTSGQNAYAKSIYIEDGGELTVNNGGNLQVMGSDSVGIRNIGILTIKGTVDISNTTDEGLYNQQYIKVLNTGLLNVHDVVASDGCKCGGTTEIYGTVNFYNISGDAVPLIGYFHVKSGGKLNIYDSDGYGITCWPASAGFHNSGTSKFYNIAFDAISIEAGTVYNHSTLSIGELGGPNNMGNVGIWVTGYLENTANGEINIENVAADGLVNIYGTLLNKGTINIDNVGRYGIYNTGTTTNISTGKINIGLNGGTGNIGSKGLNLTANSFTNAGTLAITGAVQYAIDNSVAFSNTGTLKGTGNINSGGASLSGILAPGLSPGTMTFTSDQVFAANNTLQIEVNGTPPGTGHDQVVVNGTATISGTLKVTIGYTPIANDRIVFLSATAVSGTFGTVSPALPANWALDYSVPGQVALQYSGILPVELVTFSAEKEDKGVLLKWQTASETNNQGFEMEQSSNGRDWNYLGFVNGQGTSTQMHSYSFLDKNPSQGTNYYRLRQIDFDGNFEYSDIRSVMFDGPGHAIKIFPNPASRYADIQLPDRYEQAFMRLFDAGGRQVMEEKITAGQALLHIEVSNLPAGSYLLKIMTDNSISTQKMQINRN